jgi:hypothetical protein
MSGSLNRSSSLKGVFLPSDGLFRSALKVIR